MPSLAYASVPAPRGRLSKLLGLDAGLSHEPTNASFAHDAGVLIFELARLMGTSVKVIDSACSWTTGTTW